MIIKSELIYLYLFTSVHLKLHFILLNARIKVSIYKCNINYCTTSSIGLQWIFELILDREKEHLLVKNRYFFKIYLGLVMCKSIHAQIFFILNTL